MSTREPTEAVSSHLDALYEAFDGFDVTQTTVSVDAEEFAAFEGCGVTEVRVQVEGSEGVLAVPDGGEWAPPGGVVEGGHSLSAAAERLVRDQTGVDCTVEDLLRVSLVCLQREDEGGRPGGDGDRNPDQAWELHALFSGSVRTDGAEPGSGAAWRESLPEPSAAF